MPFDGLSWRTARSCNGGSCITVAVDGNSVFIGDTKSPGTVLIYSQSEWLAFAEGIRLGDFDNLW
jgi:hypothetical protein